MSKWAWAALVGAFLICAIVAGIFQYKSKCRGVDACAAQEAESQERDKPAEAQ